MKGLDAYLTNIPDDGYNYYCELVVENFSNEFYNANVAWIEDYNGLCNNWLEKCFYRKGWSPYHSTNVIERAFKLYKII